MEQVQQERTPRSVIQHIIASKKVMFLAIMYTIVAVLSTVDVIVNRVDLAEYTILGISIGKLLGSQITEILDIISTILLVFAIIGVLPAIAQAIGFWLIKQGVKDDYASQKRMHVGFLIVKIPLYYSAVINVLYGLGLLILGTVVAINTGAFFAIFIALIISMYFLLLVKYYMGLLAMFAGFTNTMRTGYNMTVKNTFAIVLNWIAAIFAFFGIFSGGFVNILACLGEGLSLIFLISIFTQFNKEYGVQTKADAEELKKQFTTNPSLRNVALAIGYKENPLNPNELTMTFGGSFKFLFGTKIPDENASKPTKAQTASRVISQRQNFTPTRSNILSYALAPTNNDQKLDAHLLSIFSDDMEQFDQRFSSLGKKEYRGDLECPVKPVIAQVFKDSVTEKTILRIEFTNKINSSIKKIKYEVTPCLNDGSSLGVISGVEVTFDVAVEKDQTACAQFGLVLPDEATNGRVKITYVEFSDSLFWDKGSNDFYFTTDDKTDYDMNLYLSING